MTPALITLSILGGFIGLIVGGELLVRGASNLAAAAKVPPLVIGLTVVAFGTSAPELAVSVQSCYVGKTDLAVGNSVGSNLSNLLLILGVAAIAAPLSVSSQLFRLDIPVMLAAAGALFALGFDGSLDRADGVVLVIAMALYLGWTVLEGRREGKRLETELEGMTPQDTPRGAGAILLNVVWFLFGLALLVVGADWLVDGCVELATRLGVGEAIIGLTIVAIGTSLPELVISVLASLKGKRDLAVGNVVGSNILNIVAVLGISGIVAPAGVNVDSQLLSFDIPLMLFVSLACVPVFLTGSGVSRFEGICMVLYYLAYLGWLAYSVGVLERSPGVWDLVGFLSPLAVAMVVLLATHRRGA